ncbi:MAG: prepilin peptidase, partial [Bdellovibrionota bacterium]
ASLWLGRGALFASSASGLGAGLLFYGWLFYIGAASGGDVKLLMALGAWGGFQYAAEVAIFSVLLGGVFAVFLLASKGKLGAFVGKIRRFLMSLAVRELAVEFPQVDRKLKMPFGVPMAVAAVWIAWDNPFSRWGWWT